jgi:hypothetical protein
MEGASVPPGSALLEMCQLKVNRQTAVRVGIWDVVTTA